jgi:putative protease
MKQHELLAPAGSVSIARAVIDAGADAVYLAGNQFGARAYAGNLSEKELFEIIDYAHVRGSKIHLTVNTLVKNREFDGELFDFIRPLYEHGLDAAIVQDFGVIRFLRRNFPELSIHGSTQLSVTGIPGAEFLKSAGAERIVTARELSLKEISSIRKAVELEIETFIHGALCYSYSGQCLMSSLYGGRSGNRGRCAQPCRLPYSVWKKEGNRLHPLSDGELYPLSMKDLCAVDLLPDLCRAGIDSFKIEGRMKQLEYAAGVTEIYRYYLDLYEADPSGFSVSEKDRARLLAYGNRSGFTGGYYFCRNGHGMLADHSPSHSSGSGSPSFAHRRRLPVQMAFYGSLGAPAVLTAQTGDFTAAAVSEEMVPAQNRPLSAADVKKQLKKTGDTPFVLADAEVELEDGLFFPVSRINELRREALEQLQAQITASFHRTDVRKEPQYLPVSEDSVSADDPAALYVTAATREQMRAAAVCDFVQGIDLDYPKEVSAEILKEDRDMIRSAGKQAGYCFSYVLRSADRTHLLGFDRYVVRSYDSLGMVWNNPSIPRQKIVLDAGIYVFSRRACEAFREMGIRRHTLPLELNAGELMHQYSDGAELMIYGRIPLMLSAQCLYRNYDVCVQEDPSADGALLLADRYQNYLPVKRVCSDCMNIIYQNRPLYLLDHGEKLKQIHPSAWRIVFTCESGKEAERILREYDQALGTAGGYQAPDKKIFEQKFSRGHFSRGVK